jgi:hypothetical protein
MPGSGAQAVLWFGADSTPAPSPATWERLPGSLGKLNTVHVHTPSGCQIHHCGHPTANFPYLILTPGGRRILAPNGRGFQRLNLAKQYVEEMRTHDEIA